MRLTVTRTFAVADLGTVAFIGLEPIALAFGTCHRVLVTRPDGGSVEAVASIEAVREDSSGDEFPALLFESLAVGDLAPGSSVVVLGEVCDDSQRVGMRFEALMFEVQITAAAMAMLDRRLDRHEEKFGIMVRRVGRAGDNFRDSNGDATWSFEEKHPWEVRIAPIPDGALRTVTLDGIKVYLPFEAAPGELGIVVTVKGGMLHVEERHRD